MSISSDHFSRENAESDSDANSDVAADDYQPISALDDHDSDTESNSPDLIEHSSEYHVQNPNSRNYSNGIYQAENGISSLDLSSSNGGGFNGCDEIDEEEEEEEERMREAAEREISRAFREDERRRSAPLTPENASRIVDVMRGVSFRGFAPDWADRVPDDQWVDRLRRLREPTS